MHPWESLFPIVMIFRCSMGSHFAQDGSVLSPTGAPPDTKMNDYVTCVPKNQEKCSNGTKKLAQNQENRARVL